MIGVVLAWLDEETLFIGVPSMLGLRPEKNKMKRIIVTERYNIDIDTKYLVKMPLYVMDKSIEHITDCYNHDIVVLGNSGDYQGEEFTIPENVYKIYCQGINFSHDKVTPIPLGILQDQNEHIDMAEKRTPDKLCFRNFSIKTNRHLRGWVIKMCQGLDFIDEIEFSCSHLEQDPPDTESYGDYIVDLYSRMTEYKFGVSPIGNGLDCYRSWEYLYLGIIPIVMDIPLNRYFSKEVPMVLVDDYGDLTEDFLNEEYDRIKNKEWNWDFIYQDYHDNLIKKDIEHLTKSKSLL